MTFQCLDNPFGSHWLACPVLAVLTSGPHHV